MALVPLRAAVAIDHVTLQLKWKHQFQFAGFYAAVEKGYYRDAGLDVTLRELDSNESPIDTVLSGGAEFGIASSELIAARATGKPVVVVATILQHSPLVILAHPDIHSVDELEGRRVMLDPGEVELFAFLRREGVDPKSVQQIPPSFNVDDLVQGRVDALSGYVTDDPFELKSRGFHYTQLTPRSAGIDFYGDTLFTSEALARRNPRLVSAFRKASLQGWRYAMGHVSEMADLIVSQYHYRYKREHLLYEAEKMRQLMQPDLVEIGIVNPSRWQQIADVYTEVGLIKGEVSLDGFIYDDTPARLPGWFRKVSVATVLLFAILALVGFRLVSLTRRLAEANLLMKQQLDQVQTLQRELKEQAIRDALTGLFNRRYLDETFPRELARARRSGHSLALMMIDADHFKDVNDTYGHPAGDEVLRRLGRLLKLNMREDDVAARIGGEEFAVLMPKATVRQVAERAEYLRQTFGTALIEHGDYSFRVTLSIGIAAFPEHADNTRDLMKLADQALYTAKNSGRNRVVVFSA